MNGAVHQWTAALATATFVGRAAQVRGKATAWPLAGAGLAAMATRLPDILEPAVPPNRRQFFHSVAFAALVAAGWCKLYEWQPQDDGERLIRMGLMVCAGAYLCHLALDALTTKSLPLVGR